MTKIGTEMAISYIEGKLQIHGLHIQTKEELEQLKKLIEKVIRNIHPNYRFENDVEFEINIKVGELIDE